MTFTNHIMYSPFNWKSFKISTFFIGLFPTVWTIGSGLGTTTFMPCWAWFRYAQDIATTGKTGLGYKYTGSLLDNCLTENNVTFVAQDIATTCKTGLGHL